MAIHASGMIVDKQDQLEKVEYACLPDETIRAVFDMKGAGTGFLGITDKRIIYYDKAFMRKQKALVSIPYSRITVVGSEDNSGLFFKKGFFVSDKLTICGAGFDYKTFEFRGGEKAHQAHNLLMEYMLQ